MKKRLQKLWNEVTPDSGPCPRPDVKKVQRRVDAALDGTPRAVSRRTLRLAFTTAAAILLLTGIAGGGELIFPEFNVLSTNFNWGENPETAIAMMTITPVSVEDNNYTMTVTSSLADGSNLYFTLIIEPKNDEARERLQETETSQLLSYRIPGGNSCGGSYMYDAEADALLIDISIIWKPAKNVSVRCDLMEQGIWLNFPVKTVRSLTMKINAEAQGIGSMKTTAGPVTMDRVEISPLSYTLRYYASGLSTYPLPYFLFKDGSIRTTSQLRVSGPSGGSNYGLFDQNPGRFKCSWQFGSVQDLSLMEAIVLGGTAYPLDGSAPYEVDISGIPQPFVIPLGEEASRGYWSVPLFALCEGLGADCRWDKAAGVAVASFRDTTLTFTAGSKTVQVDGPWNWDTSEEDAAPVYQDGELWVDAMPLFRTVWSINMTVALEDWENPQRRDDGSAIFTSWLVNP